MKLNLFIRSDYIEDFLTGDYDFAINATSMEREQYESITSNIYAGSVEVDIDIDEKKIRQIAVDLLDERITKERAKMQSNVNQLEQRKQNLLVLEHNHES